MVVGSVQGIELVRERVRPEWIDANEHMNVAYYVLAFDLAIDELWSRIGITTDYLENDGGSTFAVECHVTWQRELMAADPYLITSQILAYDHKRIHQFMRMYHADDGYLAATSEWVNLHVDIRQRRVSAWPEKILDLIARFAAQQGDWPYPDDAGRQMQVRDPVFSMWRANDE